jgi:hypothetical protein
VSIYRYPDDSGCFIVTIEGVNYIVPSVDEALDIVIDGVAPESAVGIIEDLPSWLKLDVPLSDT